eukprot:gene32481-42079_t
MISESVPSVDSDRGENGGNVRSSSSGHSDSSIGSVEFSYSDIQSINTGSIAISELESLDRLSFDAEIDIDSIDSSFEDSVPSSCRYSYSGSDISYDVEGSIRSIVRTPTISLEHNADDKDTNSQQEGPQSRDHRGHEVVTESVQQYDHVIECSKVFQAPEANRHCLNTG